MTRSALSRAAAVAVSAALVATALSGASHPSRAALGSPGSRTPAASKAIGAAGRPPAYAPPQERIPAELAQPDAELVVNNCMSCHSLDYIVTQPRGSGPQFWRDEVTKMLTVYKAPIAPEDADAVAKVLGRKFG